MHVRLISMIVVVLSLPVLGDLVVENSAIRVNLDETDGSVRQVYNKLTGQELIDRSTLESRAYYYRSAWWYKMNTNEARDFISSTCESAFTSFNATAITDGYELTWTTSNNITLISTVVAPSDEKYVRFTIDAQNSGANKISILLYPWIRGWKTLGSSSDDWLAEPYAGGFRCKQPFTNYPAAQTVGGSVQMCAYWDSDGGFGFTTDDISTDWDSTEHWWKMYTFCSDFDLRPNKPFYYTTGDSLRDYGVRHLHPTNTAGADMTPPFGTRIYALGDGEDWQHMASYYKDIVIPNAAWVSKGRKEDQPASQYAHWLDESAACVFAMSGRRPEVEKYYDPNMGFHRMMGGAIFWVTHYDWATVGSGSSKYGDEAWLDQYDPRKPDLTDPIHPNNVAQIRAAGEHFTPFIFDTTLSDTDDDWGSPHNWGTASTGKLWVHDDDHSFIMCPHEHANTQGWRDFEFWLWEEFATSTSPDFQSDGTYTDIGIATTGMVDCANTSHGHQTTGWGYSVPAWIKFYRDMKDYVSTQKGSPIVFGCEGIAEVLAQTCDFFQMRHGGGVLGEFEAGHLINQQRTGNAEAIPMHQFIYHGYGAQTINGWLKLGSRLGDIFFYNSARVTLWGAIPEFNYEFSATEIFTQHGMSQPGYYLNYHDWVNNWYVENPAPVVWQEAYEFSQEIGAARTGFGKDYLCWGEMVPTQEITSTVPLIDYDWENYNQLDGGVDSGTLYNAPQLVYYSWKYRDQKLGYFFANCGETNVSVTTDIDPSDYGFVDGQFTCMYKSLQDTHSLPTIIGETQLTFTVPDRQIVLIEVEPIHLCPNLDGVGLVNFIDYSIFADDWLVSGPNLPGDLNTNQVVDKYDLKIFVDKWLGECN